jgi:hypothetical protein
MDAKRLLVLPVTPKEENKLAALFSNELNVPDEFEFVEELFEESAEEEAPISLIKLLILDSSFPMPPP